MDAITTPVQDDEIAPEQSDEATAITDFGTDSDVYGDSSFSNHAFYGLLNQIGSGLKLKAGDKTMVMLRISVNNSIFSPDIMFGKKVCVYVNEDSIYFLSFSLQHTLA